ncbi:MarR family transcriptional regulator, 2-MHQ and catechol-resistance regulon repressor [Alteribacillus bidgolensis]|uniref:MarR family transcriptional regulator, 2-MHQ and catechol-resistance regulon repressor n=2 Tax=Alteribacillus bidgolensis TaxID=930129 RepID=A0A1G8JM08_9BACI|nr:MarR family transcriptional regulator, 2-MHQ and catechol-resistance regulon repressor [Alteribacillus bidgolensis]
MNKSNYNEKDLSLKSLIVLSRANHSVEEKIKEDIQKHGLNPTEFAVLELLYHKGDQPIQHIGEKILLSSGSITYVVDKLEKKQLLERKRCPKDRRVIYADITEKGTELMNDVFPKHQQAVQRIFGALNEEEKETLISLLKRIGLSLESR